ncbi:MAG: isopenicillin N synthase family oxygenase [Halobacteriovoraceae bacterium]|nr:isopenicillin N synthase family oxygenase [Halobacteriovoraceae bacterium]MCB9095172.1 isopenicillin N synthase family oxygenase [Halobacteriovoraceae bacterium]
MRKVPELSLLSFVEGTNQDKNKFIDDLFNGFKEYGFIILVDHIVDDSVIKKSYEVVQKFFELPTEVKMQFVSEAGGGQRGYTPFGVEHAKNTNMPDLKEFWHVGREVPKDHAFKKFYPQNIWPGQVIPDFKDALSKLFHSLDQTSIAILEALGVALDVPPGFFKNMIEEGNSILRPLHYPPLKNINSQNAVRSAAHEDINLITILVGATSSGLELLDKDQKWLPVKTKEGQLIVDTGDMMSRLTNDVLPATTHRVVNPDDQNSSRYSMPFFVHPNPETVLECLPSCIGQGSKYPPINSHEFLMQRLEEIGLMK